VLASRFLTQSIELLAWLVLRKLVMLFKPENRALRALLWLVIILVPGGMFLLALLAADSLQRRYRELPRLAETDLDAPLSSLSKSSG
jgi:hypothetical protein